MDVKITKLSKPDEHGQQTCTATTTVSINGIAPGVHENYVIDPTDDHGLGPVLRALVLAGKKSYNSPREPQK